MKNRVIRLLHSANGFVSGEDISRALSVSRSAVWKVIRALKDDGAVIEAAPHNGYRLKQLPDKLKPEYLGVYLNGKYDIRWFDEVVSTNTYLKDLAAKTHAADVVATTENQTGGRGRLGRSWDSATGDAIQMSFLIRPDIAPVEAGAYNFAAALGVCRAIKDICGVDTRIKWPNDIIYNGKKLCGILTEMSTDMDSVEYVVCGIGTNVNREKFEGDLKDQAVSLRMITGEKVDRSRLCAAQIEAVYDYFNGIKAGRFNELMEEYKNKSAVLGKTVKLISAGNEFTGECMGFGKTGEILLKIGDGVRAFHAGEVSLRGTGVYV